MASSYLQLRPLHDLICDCHHLALLQIRSHWILGLRGTTANIAYLIMVCIELLKLHEHKPLKPVQSTYRTDTTACFY